MAKATTRQIDASGSESESELPKSVKKGTASKDAADNKERDASEEPEQNEQNGDADDDEDGDEEMQEDAEQNAEAERKRLKSRNDRTIFVRNIPFEASEDDLHELCGLS